MKKFLYLLLVPCLLFGQTTKVGGSGTTKVGGSGVSKISAQAVINNDQTGDYVMDWNATANGTGSTLACTIAPVNNGDLMVALVKNEGNASGVPYTCTGVAGNVSGAWTAGTNKSGSNNDHNLRFFYKLAGSGTDTTITATFSNASAVFKRIIVSEFNCFTTPVLDTQATAAGSSTAANSGNIITAGADLVLGGYGEYSGATLSGLLIGSKGGVNMPEINTIDTQMWGSQTLVSGTLAASTTLSGSNPWICNVIAFKGSGARTSTTNNYAHGYLNFTGQTAGTALTTSILASSQFGQGSVSSEYAFVGTSTDLTVQANDMTLTKPLIVAGVTHLTSDASKGFGLAHTTGHAPTYFTKNFKRHSRARVTGFMHLGMPSGGGDLFDLVSLHGLAGHVLNVVQLNRSISAYLLNCEYVVSGSANHSTGATPATQSKVSFCFWMDTQASQCKFQAWDSSNTMIINDTPGIDATHEDFDVERIGNAETGVANGTTTIFEGLSWNFDTDVMQQP